MEELNLEVFDPETKYGSSKYPLQKETGIILGLSFEIYNHLGRGFSEAVYKEALEYEFTVNKIPFAREKQYKIPYKDIILKKTYYADFVVFDNVILEVKAQKGIPEEHYQQAINYLKVSKCQVGLIVNFSDSSVRFKRVIF